LSLDAVIDDFGVQLAQSGALKPVVDSRFALDSIRAAHQRVDTGRKVGAVVLEIQ